MAQKKHLEACPLYILLQIQRTRKNLKAINLAFVIQLVSDVHEKKAKNGWVCRKELVRIIRNSPKSI